MGPGGVNEAWGEFGPQPTTSHVGLLKGVGRLRLASAIGRARTFCPQ